MWAMYAGSFLWSNGTSLPTTTVNTVGNHWLQITDNLGCRWRDTIHVQLKTLPSFSLGADKLICPGETVTLQPAINPIWQLLWQNGSTAPSFTVTQPGLYYLDATARCGTTRDEVLFTKGLCKVYIPNAFTPNGDGRNDLLRVYGTELVVNFNLQVFNRYGQLVFETRDKNKGWDGRLNGKMVNNGAYIYNLTYQEQGGLVQNIAGSILLIR
jgi:gliding motility-associated-like protein